jgi:hypothetical protein
MVCFAWHGRTLKQWMNRNMALRFQSKTKIVTLLLLMLLLSSFFSLLHFTFATTTTVTACESTSNWSGSGVTISTSADCVEGTNSILLTNSSYVYNMYGVYDEAGSWNWASYTELHFWVKSNVTSTFQVQVFTDGSNWVTQSLGSAPTSWTEQTITLASMSVGAGTINWATINSMRFQLTNAYAFAEYRLDNITLYYYTAPSPPPASDTFNVHSWNFSDGSLDDLTFNGDGSHSNTTSYCNVTSPLSVGGGAYLQYDFADKGTLLLQMDFILRTLPTTLYSGTTIARLTNTANYGGEHSCYVWIQKMASNYVWRVTVGGVTSMETASVSIDTPYRLIINATMGSGSASALATVNGTNIGNPVTGLVIVPYNSVDIGIGWAIDNAQKMTLYTMGINGSELEERTISGQVLFTSNLSPVSGASVYAGIIETTTDGSGNFALTVPAGAHYLKATVQGYLTSTTYVDVSDDDASGITLHLSPYPTTGNAYWDIRSVTIFPFWFHYDAAAMDMCLTEIASKFGDGVNTIDIRILWTNNESNTNQPIFSYGQSEAENGWTVLDAAITKIHNHGFQVRLGVVSEGTYLATEIPEPTDYAVWWNNYNILIAQYGTWAETRNVEYMLIGWEFLWQDIRFEDGTWNNQWLSALNSLRETYHGQISYEFNWPDASSEITTLLSNSWVSELDFVSMSSYIPLSPTVYNSVETYTEAWSNNINGLNYIGLFQQMYETWGIPVEINVGYASVVGAVMHPWSYGGAGTPDYPDQADAWEALFLAMQNLDFIKGVDMEHFDHNAEVGDGTSSFRNKTMSEYKINNGLAMYLMPEPEAPSVLPSLNVNWMWQYLYAGDFAGFFNVAVATAFNSYAIGIAVITMIFLVALYLRTGSLLLLCIAWLLIGGFLIVAIPIVSGLAIIFLVLGLGGLIYKLFRPSGS